MRIKTIAIALLTLTVAVSHAQDKPWNNKKCAVVLTYDDALDVQLDNAIPLLDSLKLKGTFYLSTNFPGFANRINEWRKAATKGHELGNHTLFHPCIGKVPGREWVQPDYDMNTYSIKRMNDELHMCNTVLRTLDGKTKRTFAYTCGDTRIRDSLFLDRNEFVAARTVIPQMLPMKEIDLYNIGSYPVENYTGEQLIELVKQAMEKKVLLVFLFHGVGGGHSLNISLPAHRELLRFLKKNEKDIWIGTFIEVAEYIKKQKS
jgi:peptidoglycan/xylan/chitin deacetylase (PgdA/CDA1 family)